MINSNMKMKNSEIVAFTKIIKWQQWQQIASRKKFSVHYDNACFRNTQKIFIICTIYFKQEVILYHPNKTKPKTK